MVSAYATVDELGRALRAKEVSSVELTKFFLARLKKYGAKLGAVVTITRERALAEAAAADADLAAGKILNRPLLGIPYGVKDLFAADATVIEKLTAGGAVLVAKLAMIELAAASAVAAGLVPFAIGSETIGSIITPASLSGVTGLRPTYGAVSRHGAMALSWTMDKLGPFAHSAADANTILGVIMGEDERDPTTLRVFPSGRASWVSSSVMMRAPNKRVAKIALVKGTWENAQPAVRENFLKSVEALKSLGHTVAEIDYPDLPYDAAATIIMRAEGASALDEPSEILAIDYIRALRVRAKVREALLRLFEQHDLIAAPGGTADAGPPVIASMNLLGAPAICMPNGFGENGLPTSIQLNAAPANEPLLLNAGIHYQLATEHHLKTPRGFP